MKSIAANTVNDIFRGPDGNLAFVTGVDAVRQNCITAMQAIRGEMIYAKSKGMPYQQTAWDRYNPGAFEAAGRAVLLAVEGVTRVQSFQVALNGDQLVYAAQIVTVYSTSPVSISSNG